MSSTNSPHPSRSGRAVVDAVLRRQRPARVCYAPNYWQWLAHQQHHGLPAGLTDEGDQLALIRGLGLDVFSRNIYSDQQRGWFGGLSEPVYREVEVDEREWLDGQDRLFERTYRTPQGTLTERLRYVRDESTLVQEKFLLDDPENQLDALEALVDDRRWRFLADEFAVWEDRVGQDGRVIVGELYSPLKLLHLALDPVRTCYLLVDAPEAAGRIMAAHEAAMLDLAEQIARGGAKAMMAMDNLDTMFHPPRLVEQCSASFYEKAARLGHEQGCNLFIHACGGQRANLGLIGSLGVDGLEGVAFPTLGDVELDEAMQLSGDRLIITGGISALEFQRLASRADVFAYVKDLLGRMVPYAHRFVLSASCNTPYTAPWPTLLHFRDAWLEYGGLDD